MTENTAYILMWILLAAAFAFMIGWTCGEQVARCKNAEKKVAELYNQLENTCSGTQQRQFKEIRSVLHDLHKRVVAVSKALKIPVR